MNFYIFTEQDDENQELQNLIEQEFDNSLVGFSDNSKKAYDDLLQLRVDIMIINCPNNPNNGISLISKLSQAYIKPHFIFIGPSNSIATKNDAYKNNIDFYLETPISQIEFKHICRMVASQCRLIEKISDIYKISAGVATPFNQPQAYHHQQVDRVNSILRFLGISSENGYNDIQKIIHVMIDQNIPFSRIKFERDLSLDCHSKKTTFQRIRRTLKVGITNLATMCIEYPENEILLEYANCLFQYQNVYNEMQKLRDMETSHSQISIQHFFDGLLQESFGDNK